MSDNQDALRCAELLTDMDLSDPNNATGQASVHIRRLVAENEALRADAERYRWLRENSTEYSLTQKDGYGGRELLGWEELDAAIDAARSK